jgi:hypothetical protein
MDFGHFGLWLQLLTLRAIITTLSSAGALLSGHTDAHWMSLRTVMPEGVEIMQVWQF